MSTKKSIDWLIPNLLPKGKTVLLQGNTPKWEKTSLALDLAYAIISGGVFIKRRVKKGKVLLISTKHNAEEVKKLMKKRGFTQLSKKLQDNFEWMLVTFVKDLDSLEEKLKKEDYKLVIVDYVEDILENTINAVSISDLSLLKLKETLVREFDCELEEYFSKLPYLLEKYTCSGIMISKV